MSANWIHPIAIGVVQVQQEGASGRHARGKGRQKFKRTSSIFDVAVGLNICRSPLRQAGGDGFPLPRLATTHLAHCPLEGVPK